MTPMTAHAFCEILKEIDFPPGLINETHIKEENVFILFFLPLFCILFAPKCTINSDKTKILHPFFPSIFGNLFVCHRKIK